MLWEQSGWNWIGLVFVSQVAGVRKAGEYVLVRQPRVVRQEALFGLPWGKQVEDERNGQTTAANHRFAGQDLWIDDDALRQRHGRILSHRPRRVGSAPGREAVGNDWRDFVCHPRGVSQ